MSREPLTPESLAFIGTCDASGSLRGVSMPWTALERVMGRGVAAGHLRPAPGRGEALLLLPDAATRAFVPVIGAPDVVLLLGDLLELDGTPWECCPRYFLRRAVAALHAEFGLALQARFRQGLSVGGARFGAEPAPPHSLAAVAAQGVFGGFLLAVMRSNEIEPDGFETGERAGVFQVSAAPQAGLLAADQAVVVRELARAAGVAAGRVVRAAPERMTLRLSLLDEFGRGATEDPEGAHGLSFAGEHFLAGVLEHLPAIAAVLMPSATSYGPEAMGGRAVRLVPALDDGAPAALELRAGDGAASPYLALGAVVWAGLDGLRRERRLAESRRGAFPASLPAALDAFGESVAVAEWFGLLFREDYLRGRREG